MNHKKHILFRIFLLSSLIIPMLSNNINDNIPLDGNSLESFGAFSITRKLFVYILEHLPEGSTILEFGSGWASGELSKYYQVYSVEHQEKWLDQFNTRYIYAPLKDGWYDASTVKKHMPKEYDLILIDGPGPRYREGILKHLHLFNLKNKIIILDDVHRRREKKLLQDLARKLNRKYQIFTENQKSFAVIFA